MLVIDKPTSCFNWQYIDKEKFPKQFNESNVKEDFNLLFDENIDPIKLKEIFRTSTREPNQAVRKFLWKRVLINDTGQMQLTMGKYAEKVGVLFRKDLTLKAELPDFVDKDHLVYYYLNEEGKAAVDRLLNVLASVHPYITFAPLLLPLASLFLHYMTEAESYSCLLAVVESNNKITETDIHWITSNHVFRRFAQKYTNSAYDYLLESLFKKNHDPDQCFEVVDNWQWWIFEYLSFNYVLNIVDSFLLEGQKVLYRFGIALLEQFYRSVGHHHQRRDTLDLDCMKQFCNQLSTPPDRLLKTAFSYRNMSRKDIDTMFQAEEKAIKKLRAKHNDELINKYRYSRNDSTTGYTRKIYATVISPFLSKSSLIEDTAMRTHPNLDANHNTISTKHGKHSVSKPSGISWTNPFKKLSAPKKWYMNTSTGSTHSFHHHHPQSSLNLPSFSVEDIGSSILTPEQIASVWRWLPTRYQILELQLVYSTNIHGCRLITLFDNVEYYPASIIVILTTTNSIFGAFCSQPWSNRINHSRSARPRFFGNGETFLFEMIPNKEKYEWVGKKRHGNTAQNQEMFQYADMDKLIIGGGSDNSFGLLINNDLIYGRTNVSDTFENKILGTETDFEIAILEVLSFKSNSV